MSSSEAISIWVVVGVVAFLALFACCFCCYRRFRSAQSHEAVVALGSVEELRATHSHPQPEAARIDSTSLPSATLNTHRWSPGVPQAIQFDPAPGTYRSPCPVKLVCPGCEIYVRILKISDEKGYEGTGSRRYLDELLFTEPGSYRIDAHALGRDAREVAVTAVEYHIVPPPPIISPSSGEVLPATQICIYVKQPNDQAPLSSAPTKQQEVYTIFYSTSADEFPTAPYTAPFVLDPATRPNQQATIQALCVVDGIRSDVARVTLTMVSIMHLLDTNIASPTLRVDAANSYLSFEPLGIQQHVSRNVTEGSNPRKKHAKDKTAVATVQAQLQSTPFQYPGVYQCPIVMPPQSSMVPVAASASASTPTTVPMGAQIWFAVDHITTAKAVSRSSRTVAGEWKLYTGPLLLGSEVAQISACTVVPMHRTSAMRSKVVRYDVSRQIEDGSAQVTTSLSDYAENDTLPVPVMRVECRGSFVGFDPPPAGGKILYTLNGTDPSDHLASLWKNDGDFPNDVFEWNGFASDSFRIDVGETRPELTIKARICYRTSSGFRYGYLFSRTFSLS